MPAKQNLTAKVAAIRAEISDKRDQITHIKSAALPKAEMLERLDAWINASASAFDPAHALAGLWLPGEPIDLAASVRQVGPNTRADLSPALCWLAPDEIKARIRAELEPRCDDSAPRSIDREDVQVELQAELHALEISEEALIREAEAAGEPVHRRSDADPAIVLAHDKDLHPDKLELAA